MPLRIIQEKLRNVPRILCDECGEIIETEAEGNVEWRYDAPCDFPGAAVYFTHKKCGQAFRANNPGDWCWMPIGGLLVYLRHNLQVDWKHAERWAKLSESL